MKFVPNAVSRTAARTILKTQQSSPKTLFVVGLVSMGATVFFASKATLRIEEILEDTELRLEKIGLEQNNQYESNVPYTDADARKDRALVYLQATGDLARLYAPAIACGVVTVAALAGSHNILTKRNAALAAAYTTIEKAFDEYRGRIRQELGEEKERDIYRNSVFETIEDPETGKKVKTSMSSGGTPYSFLFDEYNRNWEQIPEYNFMFLKMQQQYANHRLQARGHLFLNEVLESLGIEHTQAGAVTGWVRGEGDDYVDFGIFNEGYEERIVEFMAGREKAVWLDFNVDGVIYNKI